MFKKSGTIQRPDLALLQYSSEAPGPRVLVPRTRSGSWSLHGQDGDTRAVSLPFTQAGRTLGMEVGHMSFVAPWVPWPHLSEVI